MPEWPLGCSGIFASTACGAHRVKSRLLVQSIRFARPRERGIARAVLQLNQVLTPISEMRLRLLSSNSPVAGRLPALDGLRGVGIFAVFLVHYVDNVLTKPGGHPTVFWFGWAGVDLFFVLSGFLITGVLLDTRDSPRFFRNFYIRRSLRIFPLFYGVWAVFLLLTPFVHVEWNRYVFLQMFYLGNWTTNGAALGFHPDPGILMVAGHPFIFGHYWTLCLEEQFYLIWPLVVFFFPSRKTLLRIAISASAAVLVLRCFLILRGLEPTLYNVPYARVDTLLIGAALVLWLRGREKGYIPAPSLYVPLILVPTAVFLTLLVTLGRRGGMTTSNPLLNTVGFSLLALSAAGMVLASFDSGGLLYRFLTIPSLMRLGMVSYGFYVFHAIPLRIILVWFAGLPPRSHAVATVLIPIVAFFGFYALSLLSFRYWETPFLRLKDRLAGDANGATRRAIPSVQAAEPQPEQG
jgi:peptidoglycan/LPS O-acetylase OafA/YrhL